MEGLQSWSACSVSRSIRERSLQRPRPSDGLLTSVLGSPEGLTVRKVTIADTTFVKLGDVWHNIDLIVKVTNSVVVFSDGTRVPHDCKTGAKFLEEVGGVERIYG